MRYVTSACLLIVGIIHLLPLTGVLGADRVAALYGVTVDSRDLSILLRHRAVLFGLLGGFFVFAAFRPALQRIAITAGFVSVVSFLWLAFATGGYNDAIGRVVFADLVALGCLFGAAVSLWWSTRSP